VSSFSVQDLRAQVDAASDRLSVAVQEALAARQTALSERQAELRRLSPVLQLTLARQQLAALTRRAASEVQHQLEIARERHQRLTQALNGISPLAVLQRGYAIVRKPDGIVVRQTQDARVGESLRVRVSDGEFNVKREA
jgi:exodeoxyribonuclease VII large subunit